MFSPELSLMRRALSSIRSVRGMGRVVVVLVSLRAPMSKPLTRTSTVPMALVSKPV